MRFFGLLELADRLMFDPTHSHRVRRRKATLLRVEYPQGGKIWIGRVNNRVSGAYPLHRVTTSLLATWKEQRQEEAGPYLLTSRREQSCRPFPSSTVYQRFRKYAQRAGLPTGLRHDHELRHSVAVHLMYAGWDAAQFQGRLGHRRISLTMIYG